MEPLFEDIADVLVANYEMLVVFDAMVAYNSSYELNKHKNKYLLPLILLGYRISADTLKSPLIWQVIKACKKSSSFQDAEIFLVPNTKYLGKWNLMQIVSLRR